MVSSSTHPNSSRHTQDYWHRRVINKLGSRLKIFHWHQNTIHNKNSSNACFCSALLTIYNTAKLSTITVVSIILYFRLWQISGVKDKSIVVEIRLQHWVSYSVETWNQYNLLSEIPALWQPCWLKCYCQETLVEMIKMFEKWKNANVT